MPSRRTLPIISLRIRPTIELSESTSTQIVLSPLPVTRVPDYGLGRVPRLSLIYQLSVTGRSTQMLKKLSFGRFLVAVLVSFIIIGFAVFVLTGARTNKGTTAAIRAERTVIMNAEIARCQRFGTYASITILRSENFLSINPVYNSVVYIPGDHCGTIIIGSAAYQSTAN